MTNNSKKDNNKVKIDNRFSVYQYNPAKPGLYHDGGKLVIGPDNNLYAVIGDLNSIYGTAQNHDSRRESNGTSGILRINPIDGSPVKDIHNILRITIPIMQD